MTLYQIEFYGSKKNNEIKLFIKTLQRSTISKSFRIMDLLQKYGLHIGMPYVKKIEGNLYELRIRGKEEIRYLFTTRGTIFYIVYAFKKKSNKLLKKHLTIARERI